MKHLSILALPLLALSGANTCAQVPIDINGGFEVGAACGGFYLRNNCTGPVETIGGTGWEYLIWPGAAGPTAIRTHAQGGCDSTLSPMNQNQLSFPSGAPNSNPGAWNGAEDNEHYIVLRHTTSASEIQAKGIHRPLPNGLCAGSTYSVQVRYNHLKPGAQQYADMTVGLMIMTRTADQALCGPPNAWNIVAVETFTVQGDALAEWPVLAGEFTATGEEAGIAVIAKFYNAAAPNTASVRIHLDEVELQEIRCPGDFDGDGSIGEGDVAILAPNLGGDPSQPCLERFDINEDGLIDFADLGYVLSNFGTACTRAATSDRRPEELIVYPNPAQERIWVHMPGPVGSLLEILDAQGGLVRTIRIGSEGPLPVDVHDLAPGVYLLRSDGAVNGGVRSRFIIE